MDDSTEPAPHISQLTLRTSDGVDLAAELVVPPRPVAVAVLTHPHSLMGGDMHSSVTAALFRSLPRSHVAALRFDFRGAGSSGGVFGEGVAEADDVRAALDAVPTALAGVPVAVIGYSFGADVALQVLDERICGWLLIAPPLRSVSVESIAAAADQRPKLMAVPEHDQFNPPEQARSHVVDWVNTSLVVVEGGDHFLAGRTQVLTDIAVAFLAGLRVDPEAAR